MTPVGHAAFSYVVGRGAGRLVSISILGMVVGGVLPDIDFAVVWAPQFNAWHRVVTHNVFFCAVAAAVAGGIARVRGADGKSSAALMLGMMLGGLGHLFTDSTMDTNASNGIGVAWLWPLTTESFSPFNLMSLMGRPDNTAGWNDLGAAARAVLAGLVWELPWWLGGTWLWWTRQRSTNSAASIATTRSDEVGS